MELFIRIISNFILNKHKRYLFKHRYLSKYNNRIILFDDNGNEKIVKNIKNLDVVFFGNDNTIKVHEKTKFPRTTHITCTGNNLFSIDKTFEDINIVIPYPMSNGSKVIIGKNFSCGITFFRVHKEPNLEIKIGDNCMFSENINLKPSDAHTIYNKNTKEILNYPQNIEIGNHVWVGRNATVLKGSYIPENSIIAIGAIYTKSSYKKDPDKNFEELSGGYIFAGIPAKMINSNINWDRKHTSEINIDKL